MSQCAKFRYPILFTSIISSKYAKFQISMRDRSNNRKPLQKGRNLSIEAIQAVQALKRAHKNNESVLEQVFNTKVKRLIKNDLIAVLRELIRQNQCHLALKVFEEVQNEISYRPQLKLYAEMVSCLGSNGLFEQINNLIMVLKMESSLQPDVEGFYALLESLMKFNLITLAMEVFYLMKLRRCDPDKLTFKLLINGLESNEEMNLSAFVRQEAEKYYGESLNFLDETENEHIDVIFYYPRKKAKYEVKAKITTTKNYFDNAIQSLYKKFISVEGNQGLAATKLALKEYIIGQRLLCNTPLKNVDEVLFSMRVLVEWHWILGRMSYRDRCIYVYDFHQNPDAADEVKQVVMEYAFQLLLLLNATNLYREG